MKHPPRELTMAEEVQKTAISITLDLPIVLELTERARIKFSGNRSECSQHYILLGMEAERANRQTGGLHE